MNQRCNLRILLCAGIAIPACVGTLYATAFLYKADGVRDPMMPYVQPPVEVPQEPIEDDSVSPKIVKVMEMCTVEGIVISDARKYVCINKRLLTIGDKVIPEAEDDVRIEDINIESIVLRLDAVTTNWVVLAKATNILAKTYQAPINKDKETK